MALARRVEADHPDAVLSAARNESGRVTGRAPPRSLQAVRALRVRLRKIWDADEDEVVRIVNRLLREARALPQLVKHDGWAITFMPRRAMRPSPPGWQSRRALATA